MPPAPAADLAELRVAIVHEWFEIYAGSERVVEQLLQLFPHADLFAVVDFLPETERAFLGGRRPRDELHPATAGCSADFRYLPLMPLAVEQFDLSAYIS